MAGIGFSDPMPFEGEKDNNLAQMILADVIFDNTDDDLVSGVTVTVSPKSLLFCFALPPSFNESLAADGQAPVSERIYRFGCGVPLEEGEIPHAPSKEYLQNLVNRFALRRFSSDPAVNPNKPTPIKDVVWSSRFRNHASAADTTFTRLGGGEPGEGGVVLLIGDAAHIHSPVSGQGMNLSLRDAVFLGEALTKHIRASETEPPVKADAILHDFATARHTRALEVIKLTKNMLWLTGMKYRERVFWWCPIDSATVRAGALWVLGCSPFIQSRVAWELSGLGRR